ncbi:transposase [Microcoleus sp. F8-D3]
MAQRKKAFILYQNHQCRVPQNLIGEQLRELGIDISTGQINRLLVEEKEAFHQEQNQVLQARLQTAEYIHTDDTGARHQGKNGYCTVMGNDLFAHFTTTDSKSRQNYLRILRGPYTDLILNQYSHSYLIAQELAACHLSKLEFNSTTISQGDENWSKYLQNLDITSKQAVKTLTSAALLGSAIEHGLPPNLIILSDGAGAICAVVPCFVLDSYGTRDSPAPGSHNTTAY